MAWAASWRVEDGAVTVSLIVVCHHSSAVLGDCIDELPVRGEPRDRARRRGDRDRAVRGRRRGGAGRVGSESTGCRCGPTAATRPASTPGSRSRRARSCCSPTRTSSCVRAASPACFGHLDAASTSSGRSSCGTAAVSCCFPPPRTRQPRPSCGARRGSAGSGRGPPAWRACSRTGGVSGPPIGRSRSRPFAARLLVVPRAARGALRSARRGLLPVLRGDRVAVAGPTAGRSAGAGRRRAGRPPGRSRRGQPRGPGGDRGGLAAAVPCRATTVRRGGGCCGGSRPGRRTQGCGATTVAGRHAVPETRADLWLVSTFTKSHTRGGRGSPVDPATVAGPVATGGPWYAAAATRDRGRWQIGGSWQWSLS